MTTTDALARTFPLGPLQRELWRFWSSHRDSSAYIMPEVYFFDGDLDLAAATFALDETARRHASLRTTFQELAAEVVQVVSHDPSHLPIEVLDLADLPAAAQTEQLEAALDTAANASFDLLARPAIRLTAIRLPHHRTCLVMAVHQIVCDGGSIAIVLDEFGELYRSARRGTPADLAPAPLDYGTFVVEQLAAEEVSDDLAYWAKHLAGATASVLPGDGMDPAEGLASLDTCAEFRTLDPRLADAVSAFARRAGSTPFSVLLATMLVIVVVACDHTVADVSVGTATSSRTPRFARTVGMLTNLVVPRSTIDLASTFTDVLEQVSLNLLDAIDCQGVPFSRVIDTLAAETTATATDLVRTTFSAGAVGGLALGEESLLERVTRTSQSALELTVACEITPSGIALDWQFALRSYSRELARGYCAGYENVLVAVLEHPDTPMISLGLSEGLPRTASTRVMARPVDGRPRQASDA